MESYSLSESIFLGNLKNGVTHYKVLDHRLEQRKNRRTIRITLLFGDSVCGHFEKPIRE